MDSILKRIVVSVILVIMMYGCEKITVELPIDNPKEAIIVAKQDPDVQKFIDKWSDEFRIGFSAYFDSNENYWVVRVFPKGNIRDVELHIVIKENGTIIDKYTPLV